MIYLALGDSITHGYNATGESRRYVALLAQKLDRLERTSVHVHAKPGWTASQLAASLPKVPECILREAAIVTVMVGGNDLLRAMPWYLNDADSGRDRLDQSFSPAMREILRLAPGRPGAQRLLCTVYNPFPEWDLACTAVEDLNGMIQRAAAEHGCPVVSVHRSYAGRERDLVDGYRSGQSDDFRLVRNPIHPNDSGHALLAEELFALCERRLGKPGSRGKRPGGGRRATGAAAGSGQARERRAGPRRPARKEEAQTAAFSRRGKPQPPQPPRRPMTR